jgi:hypothetical protein
MAPGTASAQMTAAAQRASHATRFASNATQLASSGCASGSAKPNLSAERCHQTQTTSRCQSADDEDIDSLVSALNGRPYPGRDDPTARAPAQHTEARAASARAQQHRQLSSTPPRRRRTFSQHKPTAEQNAAGDDDSVLQALNSSLVERLQSESPIAGSAKPGMRNTSQENQPNAGNAAHANSCVASQNIQLHEPAGCSTTAAPQHAARSKDAAAATRGATEGSSTIEQQACCTSQQTSPEGAAAAADDAAMLSDDRGVTRSCSNVPTERVRTGTADVVEVRQPAPVIHVAAPALGSGRMASLVSQFRTNPPRPQRNVPRTQSPAPDHPPRGAGLQKAGPSSVSKARAVYGMSWPANGHADEAQQGTVAERVAHCRSCAQHTPAATGADANHTAASMSSLRTAPPRPRQRAAAQFDRQSAIPEQEHCSSQHSQHGDTGRQQQPAPLPWLQRLQQHSGSAVTQSNQASDSMPASTAGPGARPGTSDLGRARATVDSSLAGGPAHMQQVSAAPPPTAALHSDAVQDDSAGDDSSVDHLLQRCRRLLSEQRAAEAGTQAGQQPAAPLAGGIGTSDSVQLSACVQTLLRIPS